MATKPDPKDDRIAELELSLEAANKATSAAEAAANQLPAVRAELDKVTVELANAKKDNARLTRELSELREVTSGKREATIANLPEFAVQLKTSTLVVDALSGVRANAISGSVLVAVEGKDPKNLAAVQAKVGTAATCYAVTKDDLEAAKKSGRAY